MRLVIKSLVAILILFLISSCIETTTDEFANFYVSPDGSDSFSGTQALVDIDETDGPFRTIQRAQKAVRELKKKTNKDIKVMIRRGTYHLKEPVVFNLEDSGKKGQKIIFKNYPDEKPVITTGVNIDNWEKINSVPEHLSEKAKGKIWVADIPESLGKFYALYDGNKWLPRARSEGMFTTNRAKNGPDAWGKENFENRDKIHFPEGAIKDTFRNQDVEVIVIPSLAWSMNILPVKSVDEEKNLAITTIPATYLPGKNFMDLESPNLWIENSFQYLDEPGEWVLDSVNNKLYLWPEGNKPSETIYASSLTELVKVEGEINYDKHKDKPVKNIVLEGLTFAKADRYTWKKDYVGWGLQHNWEMFDEPSAMLRFRGAENCKVINCTFTNSAAAGVRFDLYAQNNEVTGCNFSDLGGVAILLQGYGPGTKDVNKNNKIVNNHIHGIGKVYWHSPAVWAWQSGHNVIANNLIHNTSYSAIIVTGRIAFDKKGIGECSRTVRWEEIEVKKPKTAPYEDWKKVEKYLHARKNMVKRNKMYKVCDKLGDGNAIYISGCGTGNIAKQNIAHDMTHLWATSVLRFDDKSYEQTFEQNLVYDCAIPALIMKHPNNKYNNNIFVNCGTRKEKFHRRYAYIAMRAGPVTDSEVKYNIIYNDDPQIDAYEYGETYREPTHLNQCDADYNVYFCPSNPSWQKDMLAKHKKMRIEKHSLIADPQFVDPENHNYRLKETSPVLDFPGYKQIPFEKIGLLKD